MKKILFPTDFSENSVEVLKFALSSAYHHDATLVAFHAFGKPNILDRTEEELKEQVNRTEDRLSFFVGNNMDQIHQNVKVEYLTQVNYPTQGILDIAKKKEIDLIVMGINSAHGGDFFGHKALQILEKANCQLLVIPKGTKFKGIHNIVLTVDFEKINMALIEQVTNFSRQVNLFCLHVLENETKKVGVWKIINELEGVFKNKRVYFDVVKGGLQEEVKDYAETKEADIVAMITRKQGFFARLLKDDETKKIARNLAKPFWVIKERTLSTSK